MLKKSISWLDCSTGSQLTTIGSTPFALSLSKGERGDNKGFTLIEIMIAIAILAVIMVMIYGSFVQTRKVIGAAEAAVEGEREIRAVFRMMTTDLSSAFLTRSADLTVQESTVFLGTDAFIDGYPMDGIDFSTFSHRRRIADAKESDQTVVGYFLREDLEETATLMRREKKRLDATPLDGGKVSEMTTGVLGIDFRYRHKDGTWYESWDSRGGKANSGQIPQAVEVTLILRDYLGNEHPYRTIIELPMER